MNKKLQKVLRRRRRRIAAGLFSWPSSGVQEELWRVGYFNTQAAVMTTPQTAALDGDQHAVGETVLVQPDGNNAFSAGAGALKAVMAATGVDTVYFSGTQAGGSAFSPVTGMMAVFDYTVGKADALGLSQDGVAYADLQSSGLFIANDGSLSYMPSAGANQSIAGVPSGSTQKLAVIIRSTGVFIFRIDSGVTELIWISEQANWGAVTDVYPALNLYRLRTALTVLDGAAFVQLNTNVPAVYPVPAFSDSFSDSSSPYLTDGTLINGDTGQGDGKTLLSGTWSSDGTVASNSPTPGAEEIDNPGFDADTDWSKGLGWTIAAGVLHRDGSGSGTSGTSQTPDNSLIHEWVKVSWTMSNRVSGSTWIAIGGVGAGNETVDGTYTKTLKGGAGSSGNYVVQGYNFEGDVDDVSGKVLPLSELITCDPDVQLEYPIVRSNVSIDDGYQGGVALRIDDHTNPTKGFLVYCDTNDNEIVIWDIENSTEISATAYTYSDGATLKAAYRSDGKIWVHYNGANITADSVTVDAGSLQCGLFGTGSPSGESEATEGWQVDQCSGLEAIV